MATNLPTIVSTEILKISDLLQYEGRDCDSDDEFLDVPELLNTLLREEMRANDSENVAETKKDQENTKNQKKNFVSLLQEVVIRAFARGFVTGMSENASKLEKTIPFISNIIYTPDVFSYTHVKKAITGLSSEDVEETLKNVQIAGKVARFLKFLNILAPMLTAIFDACDVVQLVDDITENIEKEEWRSTIRKILAMIATSLTGFEGAVRGTTIASAIFPGIEAMIGTSTEQSEEFGIALTNCLLEAFTPEIEEKEPEKLLECSSDDDDSNSVHLEALDLKLEEQEDDNSDFQ